MKKFLFMAITALWIAGGCHKNNDEPSDTYDEGVEINGVVWATRNVGLPGTFADANNEPIVVYRWNSRVGWVWKNGEAKSTDGTTWLPPEFPISNWSKENDPCPQGWHIPNSKDVDAMNHWVTNSRNVYKNCEEYLRYCDGLLRPLRKVVWVLWTWNRSDNPIVPLADLLKDELYWRSQMFTSMMDYCTDQSLTYPSVALYCNVNILNVAEAGDEECSSWDIGQHRWLYHVISDSSCGELAATIRCVKD